ncbi:hypothetical protein JCM10207_007429 [Rhodosporidiobolus poonsookiae]
MPQWGTLVRRVRVEGRIFASKGYGVRINRVLKACPEVERVEVVGVDDLRMKHLVGNGSTTHLTLLNSSFHTNAHTCPSSLPSFLSALTHLTVANLGLPPPSTHLTDLLHHCAPTLEHLALSSLRDVDLAEFQRALATLVRPRPAGAGKLRSLMLGFLTDAQVSALTLPLPPALDPTSASAARSLAPLLARLPVTHLTFTLPLPSLPLLLALPPTLRVLTIRPPYARARTSPSTAAGAAGESYTPPTTVFGTDKPSLLSVLDRSRFRRRDSSRPASVEPTPAPTPGAATPLPGSGAAPRRRPSVTLEQVEEEEAVLLALEEALALPPAPPGKGPVAPDEVVAPRLERVRWECRATRCGRGRVREVVERRREWRERVSGEGDE